MLMTDVGDGFGRFRRQHSKDVTNIEILSPTPENYHQHRVTNIYGVLSSEISVNQSSGLSELVCRYQ